MWAMQMLILGEDRPECKVLLALYLLKKSQILANFLNQRYAVLEIETCKGLDDHILAIDSFVFCTNNPLSL